MFTRQQASLLKSRLSEPALRIQVITGPRQTGKTTLIRQILVELAGDSHTYSAIDEPIIRRHEPVPQNIASHQRTNQIYGQVKHDLMWLVTEWEQARANARQSQSGYVLVLDEIQKIPQWSEAVKGLWDADRVEDINLHVVLLGSAPLLMQQGLTESLQGRFEVIRLGHWSFAEMYRAFDFSLETYLYFGGYPGSATYIHDQQRWLDYILHGLIEPNIEKDILLMTRVDKPTLLKRVFELACHYSGQELSYTKMQGQLQDAGNTTTLAHYLDLLTSAGLVTGLQKYSTQQHRRRASSPKLCVMNTALMSALSGYTFEQAKADRTFWGRLTESSVGAHLINNCTTGSKLHYWREKNDEVDFVFERGRLLVAFEVKSGISRGKHKGLESFASQFQPHKTHLIGDGGWPLELFLTSTPDDWFA
jgi:uncharacterized protein